jgi:hypothetical protein
MFMLKSAVAVLLVAVVTGCGGESPVAPEMSALAAVVSRPAGGQCTVSHLQNISPPGDPVVMTIEGTCTLKHLGLASFTGTQWLNDDGSYTNQTIYTAANGDVLVSEFAGQVLSLIVDAQGIAAVEFEGTETYGTFSWGEPTGRFAGASGSSAVWGTAVQSFITGAGSGQYSTSGSISF